MAAAIPEPVAICDGTDREAWLEARRSGVGSSDAPAILGISPFSNPFELALEKRGLREPDERAAELLRWGQIVERPMLELFLSEYGQGLEGTLDRRLWRSQEPGHEFMQATPDGFVRDGDDVGGVECKLKLFHAREWERDGLPDYVITQVQHQMRVMGWRWAFVLVLLDGYRLRFKRVERNDDILDAVVIPREREWWEDFQSDRAFDPTIGKQSATERALKRLYPEDSGETIDLRGSKWVEHWEQSVAAAKARKAWEEIEKRHKHALQAAIGKATYARLDDGSQLSLKTTRVEAHKRDAYSYRALRRIDEGK